jgi:hypothetical protein
MLQIYKNVDLNQSMAIKVSAVNVIFDWLAGQI